MKKVYSRIKNMFDRKQINKVYILAGNCMAAKMYKKDIQINTEIHKMNVVILNKNNIKVINLDKDIIVLCGRWYLNRLSSSKELKELLKKCYSIPVDEIGG